MAPGPIIAHSSFLGKHSREIRGCADCVAGIAGGFVMTVETIHQFQEGWICPLCKQLRGPDGHDPCIKDLPGVKYACCGHGGLTATQGYIYFENGVRIGMRVESVSYDDHRHSVQVPGKRRR